MWTSNGLPGDPIETARGVYDWSAFDIFMKQCAANGTKVTWAFTGSPYWARADHNSALLPDSTTDATDFLTAMLIHAASVAPGVIDTIEIWNEMNGIATAAAGAAFGIAVYNAAKAFNSGLRVIAPSLSAGFNAQWLHDYFAAGGPGDALNWHGYQSTPEIFYPNRVYTTNSIATGAGLNIPNWMTETSYEFASEPAYDPVVVAQKLAVTYLVLYGLGVQRAYWFPYEERHQDTDTTGMWDVTTRQLLPAGVAFGQVYSWLNGASVINPIQRLQAPNGITNPIFAGAVAGSPGTLPIDTGMGTSSNGITRSIIAVSPGSITFGFTGTAAGGDAVFTFRMNRPNESTPIPASNGQTWTQTFHFQHLSGSATGVTYTGEVQLWDNTNTFLADLLAVDQLTTTSDQQVDLVGTINNVSVAKISCNFDITIANGTNLGAGIQVKFSFPTLDNSTVWGGDLSRPNGYLAKVLWNMAGNSIYTGLNPTYKQYRDIAGNVTVGVPTNMTIGISPLLFESRDMNAPASLGFFRFLRDHSIGGQFIDAGAVQEMFTPWVPTADVEPLDSTSLAAFYAAGPQMGGPWIAFRTNEVVPKPVTYWTQVSPNVWGLTGLGKLLAPIPANISLV